MRKRNYTALAGIALAGILMTGCATATAALWSEDRLTGAVEARYGYDRGSVRISNVNRATQGTYFDATLPDGSTVRCFHDGNALGAGLFSNGVRCGDDLERSPFG